MNALPSVAISRRRALQWLAALGATAASASGATTGTCPLADELGVEGVGVLGREYLSQYPNDAAVASLTALLQQPPADDVVMQLRSQMQQDFSAARMVNLTGWFVSVTEARVFAALSRCS